MARQHGSRIESQQEGATGLVGVQRFDVDAGHDRLPGPGISEYRERVLRRTLLVPKALENALLERSGTIRRRLNSARGQHEGLAQLQLQIFHVRLVEQLAWFGLVHRHPAGSSDPSCDCNCWSARRM